MPDYNRLADTALRLIQRSGAPFVLTQQSTTDYDPASATADIVSKSTTGKAVREEYKTREKDGTLIQQNDVKFLIAAKGMPMPKPGDKGTFDGDVYDIINCDPLKPATIAVIYTAQARRG